ncbi:hypothetical protein [Robertmurraya sp. P23]|uniref:hypothetical protein n=1 Tax=Robertmurraya sp. P23 TaxID=3436931 RepID=UPI003D997E51
MKKLKVTILALIMALSIPAMALAAVNVNNGALKYNGGQNDTTVYSEIWDNMTSYRGTTEDNVNYGVIASVKVGSNTYTSQWRVGYAYKSASRVWYANESSHYNYEVITTKYSSTTWGKTY